MVEAWAQNMEWDPATDHAINPELLSQEASSSSHSFLFTKGEGMVLPLLFWATKPQL